MPKRTLTERWMAVSRELTEWSWESSANRLPFPHGVIFELEEAGYVVDLQTGDVVRDPDAIPTRKREAQG